MACCGAGGHEHLVAGLLGDEIAELVGLADPVEILGMNVAQMVGGIADILVAVEDVATRLDVVVLADAPAGKRAKLRVASEN